MTPAEKRIKDLIDRWLTSLDLHLQYVDLNDSAYNRVQPWPVHDRPSRWVLELAKQKTLELKTAFDARTGMGDAKFSDALELMMFLANMVGSQHVQRFIPLADPERHGQSMSGEKSNSTPAAPAPPKQSAPVSQPAPITVTPVIVTPVKVTPPNVTQPKASEPATPRGSPSTLAPTLSVTAIEPTVEMPRTRERNAAAQSTPQQHSNTDSEATREMPRPQRANTPTARPAKNDTKSDDGKNATAPSATTSSKPSANNKSGLPPTQLAVIADAVRLINWGRSWHELAELIARMADRPKLQDVRKILRSHRSEIEARAAAEAPESEQENKSTKTKPKK